MPFYSEEIIEEVRMHSDVVEVIGGYVQLKRRGNNYVGLCPFHNEKTPSFSVSASKQMFYCFGCGAGGNVFTFLTKYENLNFAEAVELLADRAGLRLPQQEMTAEQKEKSDKKGRILEAYKETAEYYYRLLRSPRGERAYRYFRERGLSDEILQKFGLGYADQYSNDLYKYLKKKGYTDDSLKDSGLIRYDEVRGGCDRFWNRAMFPIFDVRGKVIAFGGRVMGEGEPKYLNSPETLIFDKSRSLYGIHIAKNTRRSYFLLCEGYMDVIALHQAGFDNAVASLGTSFTSGHASLLKRYTKEVYVTYDSDEAGIKAALRAIPILREAGILTKIVNMKPYKDPDEFIKALGASAYEERIAQAENSFLFEVRILEESHNMEDPEEKHIFFKEAAKKLLQFEDEIQRNTYMEAVASKYGVEYQNLRKLVNKLGLQQLGTPASLKKQSEGQSLPKKDTGIQKSQKLLLTWLIENEKLFATVDGVIVPKDFTEELYQKVAKELFEQYHTLGQVYPARIVDMFEDEAQQQEVAALFNARIHPVENAAEWEKAVRETIYKVKQHAINERCKHSESSDLAGMMQIIEDKKALEKIEKLKFA